MTLREQVSDDVDSVWDLQEDDLMELLGVSQMGSEDISESIQSFSMLSSIAEEVDRSAARTNLSESLKEKGLEYFSKLWESVKAIICQVYSEGIEVEGKDLVKYLAGVLIAAGKLTNGLVVLVVTIAVKRGLEILCKA